MLHIRPLCHLSQAGFAHKRERSFYRTPPPPVNRLSTNPLALFSLLPFAPRFYPRLRPGFPFFHSAFSILNSAFPHPLPHKKFATPAHPRYAVGVSNCPPLTPRISALPRSRTE